MGRLKFLLLAIALAIGAIGAPAIGFAQDCPLPASQCPKPQYDGVRFLGWPSTGRPSPDSSYWFNYNTTIGQFEFWNPGTASWQPVGGGGGGGSGDVNGPGSSTPGFVPQWGGSAGTNLTTGLQPAQTGANVLLETGSGGLISPSVLPPGSNTQRGALNCDGITTACPGGQISVIGGGGGGGSSSIPDLIDTYHADPTGGSSSQAAVVAAAASGTGVVVECGTYALTAPVPITSGSILRGLGRDCVHYTTNSPTADVFTFANGVNGAGITDATITRSVSPASPSCAISSARTGGLDDVENIQLVRLHITTGHYNGMCLGPTSHSLIEDVDVEQTTAAGIYGTTTTGVDAVGTGSISGTTLTFTGGHLNDFVLGAGVVSGTQISGGSSGAWTVSHSQTISSETITLATASNPWQWEFRGETLIEFTGGPGMLFQPAAQAFGVGNAVSVGEWAGIQTFATGGPGIEVLGNASALVGGIRLSSNSFLGGTGGPAVIYLDYTINSYIDADIELAGQTNTGPGYATPASHTGVGIYVSPCNSGVMIGGVINANSDVGVESFASLYGDVTAPVLLNGAQITNNGVATLGAGHQAGVVVGAPTPCSGGGFTSVGAAYGGTTFAYGGGIVGAGGVIGQWNEPLGGGVQQYGVGIGADRVAFNGTRIAGANNAIAPLAIAITLTFPNSCLDAMAGGGCNGGGGVAGPGSSTSGFLPQWSGTSGTNLGTGLPVAQTGANTVVETNSSGLLNTAVLPTTIPNVTTFSGAGTGLTVANDEAVGGNLHVTFGITQAGNLTPYYTSGAPPSGQCLQTSGTGGGIASTGAPCGSGGGGGVTSVLGNSGAVTLANLVSGGVAPSNSAAFTGTNPTYFNGGGTFYLALSPVASFGTSGSAAWPISNSSFNIVEVYGLATLSGGSAAISFGGNCPNGVHNISATPITASAAQVAISVDTPTTSGDTIYGVNSGNGAPLTGFSVYWRALCH